MIRDYEKSRILTWKLSEYNIFSSTLSLGTIKHQIIFRFHQYVRHFWIFWNIMQLPKYSQLSFYICFTSIRVSTYKLYFTYKNVENMQKYEQIGCNVKFGVYKCKMMKIEKWVSPNMLCHSAKHRLFSKNPSSSSASMNTYTFDKHFRVNKTS